MHSMDTELTSFARATLLLALCLTLVPTAAQTPREQAEKELARKVPEGGVKGCSLITRADIKRATGRDPFVDPGPRRARLLPLPEARQRVSGQRRLLGREIG